MKILFIRGGALGDLIITLPTLRLLRQRWPGAHIEVLGHPRLAEIALRRYYLDGVRSVNHGPLSAFFTPRAVLDPAWMDYIGSFDLVLSYFYDPDGLFLLNLKRCKPGRILTHSPRVPEGFGRPAARYFAGMVEPLGLALGDDAASELFPSPGDAAAARAFLTGLKPGTRLAAIHPGSGGENKNWLAESWAELGRRLTGAAPGLALLLVEGEADTETARFLVEAWKDVPHLRARELPLPILAALFGEKETALFLGHDSGITHLAAASRRDLPVVALFGPTDPVVWAPPRPGVRALRAGSSLKDLAVEEVFQAAVSILEG
ncbi:MAG TPA: glycosyltransferase family 9 protein [Candidatus Methylacidiphilales bacterium]|nr:glycosyltransferase family 9 protein [Candidatus Methylacidiphilales bacterium]